MSQLCAIPTCKYKSSTLCSCCNKNICIEHVKEHNDLRKSELKSLNDETITLNDQFKTFDIDKLIKDSCEILDKWKDDCHKIINCYYEQKFQELERFLTQKIDQYRKEIDQIQSTIIDSIDNEKFTEKNLQSLKLTIYDIKQEINKMKEKGIQINIRPFILDNHTISIKDSKPNAFNINTSILSSPYHTIECIDGWQSELASNDQSILISLSNNLCLFDRDLNLIKKSLWTYECIYDMCWSSTLSNFIVITNKNKVYRIHETTLSIERIYGIEDKDWLSCTCSDTYLYLTTREIGSNIFQFKLLPLIRPVKQWQPPYSCKPHESIHAIQYNNRTLALIIRKSFGGVINIELRSSTTLNRIWTLPLDIRSSGVWSRINCSSLQYDEWLLAHTSTSRFFHISKDGNLNIIHEYHPKFNNALMFGSNILVIHLGKKVHFHKL
ncbi:unnamed protein product [Rotaria sordida]|uniref:Uncharacterized protein n=1 Tax=Rotaria sordida TaxID=392033 RepID=A0A814T5J4_9BILA|nr:unnamed protein product [Rotaria sordida]CAF1156978.1 unnamed protein product [Rotaria sordida]CAF4075842.1 unnamed protein product [Rotaria sordida]CAF4121753.1 unnamed protein product [Rotaria sordida]